MKIADLIRYKENQQKITMLTCYDYTSARIISQTDIDGILIGDSAAMVMHGHKSTINASIDMMTWHTQAVAKGIGKQFIVGDLPFLSYRHSLATSMNAVQQLMQAGAHAVKLEGSDGNLETIKYIVQSGIPVMGHIGLTPQFFHQLGGYRIQGRDDSTANKLIEQAQSLQQAGCCSLVLECVPSTLAEKITQQLTIPTIGIGAGPDTDGQILVFQDCLGLQNEIQPKFVKQFANGFDIFKDAINKYTKEVKQIEFPEKQHHGY